MKKSQDEPATITKVMILRKGRLAIADNFLINYYKVPKHIIDNSTNSNDYEYFERTVDGQYIKFIYIDTIESSVISHYNIITSESIDEETKSKIDENVRKRNIVTLLKKEIETNYHNKLLSEERENNGPLLNKYIQGGYNVTMAGRMLRIHLLIDECSRLYNYYSGDDIFLALEQLRNEKKLDLDELLPIKYRAFYDLLKRCETKGVFDALESGLKGKPSNNSKTCENTQALIVSMKMHMNNKPDQSIMSLVNTIIIAMPEKFNNGKIIGRSTLNRFVNMNRGLVEAGRGGDEYLMNVILPHAKLIKPTYPLDKVEIDFTKVHFSVKDQDDQKTKMTVCKIKDVCSGKIVSSRTSKTESYELFRATFRQMFKITCNVLPFELISDFSSAFEHREFKRVKKYIKSLGSEFRQTGNPRGKGSIESHFATLVKTHMPEYVGSTGGNIATSKRNRPRKEILLILNDVKYMRTRDDCERILYDIDKKYNSTPYSKAIQSPDEKYKTTEKPHGIILSEEIIAYLSFKRTSIKFQNSVFTLYYGSNTYIFGKAISAYINSEKDVNFLLDRTGDVFDLFYDPDHLDKIYVFERNSARFLFKLPLTEFLYGCRIDHIIDPDRRTTLLKFLSERATLGRVIKNKIKEILTQVKQITGTDAYELLQQMTNCEVKNLEPEDLIYELLDHLSANAPIEIDPLDINQPILSKRQNKSAKRTNKNYRAIDITRLKK